MFEHRSIKLPITLGVAMIIVIVALIVGWVLLTANSALQSRQSSVYWTLLTVGSLLFALVLVGVVMYLTLSIKAISLTQRQSNFVDSVTHELKSPIASLKLYLQTLRLRDVSEEERARFHQFMMDDVERLDDLINHLLDAGLIDKPRGNERSELIAVDELIQDCAATVCNRYRVDAETIQLDLAPIMIRAPRVDAVMIFRNLLDNAVKYAGTPPAVQVTSGLDDQYAVVKIADNGEGIPKALRRKVFGRFVRLGDELQRKQPGTGLGLYIVLTLVQRLGGKVRVLDRDKKGGTTFEVRLPAVGTRAQRSSPPDHTPGGTESTVAEPGQAENQTAGMRRN